MLGLWVRQLGLKNRRDSLKVYSRNQSESFPSASVRLRPPQKIGFCTYDGAGTVAQGPGRRSKANVEKVREINSELKRITYELKRAKFIPYRWDLLLRVCSKNRTAR